VIVRELEKKGPTALSLHAATPHQADKDSQIRSGMSLGEKLREFAARGLRTASTVLAPCSARE
jgi:hypothetical protein